MSDNLTKKQRSLCMSKIKSKWTSGEKLVHSFLKSRKIKHKMHPDIDGSPDIVLNNKKTVVFLHGCFWHKCRICYKEPKSRKNYWLPKIEKNVKRDKKNEKKIKESGRKIIKIWEHELKHNKKKIAEFLRKKLLSK